VKPAALVEDAALAGVGDTADEDVPAQHRYPHLGCISNTPAPSGEGRAATPDGFRQKADAGGSLRNLAGIEFRLHSTVLYNSIYRADDQVLVNTHIYNFPASQAPVLHLRRVAGGDMVNTYLESTWARRTRRP
jgi:hypothetical protein